MQFIFLVETDSISKSDYKFIRSYLTLIHAPRTDKYSPIYLNGKGNYKKKQTQINNLIKQYRDSGGQSRVFLCMDVDSINIIQDQSDMNQKIIEYAHLKGYEIIWFKRTVEEVFCGKKVTKKKRHKMLIIFFERTKSKIFKLNS